MIKSEYDLQNLTEAVFYFRKDVKSNYEYFIYSMPILFAEMGGYIGLLLGFSLFDILILGNDLIIDRFFKDQRVGAEHENGVTSIKVSQASVGFDTGFSKGSGVADIH